MQALIVGAEPQDMRDILPSGSLEKVTAYTNSRDSTNGSKYSSDWANPSPGLWLANLAEQSLSVLLNRMMAMTTKSSYHICDNLHSVAGSISLLP